MKKFFLIISLIFLPSINLLQAANDINVKKTEDLKKSEVKDLYKLDSDKDGLNDAWEIALSSDPKKSDTDGDGFTDGVEVSKGYSPISSDKKKLNKEIKINLKRQMLAYYFGDRKLEEFLISSGVKGMETPKGKFKILKKVPSKNYGGKGFDYYYPNTKWNLHFYTEKLGFYIHGAYWHNNFGKRMSHGCINVDYSRMERLYNWSDIGTSVIIE